MLISVAKLGNPIVEVTLDDGATVMDALRAADYNLDAVLSVKVNGTTAAMDSSLSDNDIILVSQDKIKGGTDETVTPDVVTEEKFIKLSFDVIEEGKEVNNAPSVFLESDSTFNIVKTALHNRGVSMNYFKEVKDEEGNVVSMGTKLADNGKYTIVLAKPTYNEEDED